MPKNKIKELTNLERKQAAINAYKVIKSSKNLSEIERNIIRNEGLRLSPYLDKKNQIAIGFGHQILPGEKFQKIDSNLALQLLKQDLAKKRVEADKLIQTNKLQKLNPVQKDAIVEMMYQLGQNSVRDFADTIKSLKKGKSEDIFKEALDSKWFREDSPKRALEVATRLSGISPSSKTYLAYKNIANKKPSEKSIAPTLSNPMSNKTLAVSPPPPKDIELEDLPPSQLEKVIKFAKNPDDANTKEISGIFKTTDRDSGTIKDTETPPLPIENDRTLASIVPPILEPVIPEPIMTPIVPPTSKNIISPIEPPISETLSTNNAIMATPPPTTPNVVDKLEQLKNNYIQAKQFKDGGIRKSYADGTNPNYLEELLKGTTPEETAPIDTEIPFRPSSQQAETPIAESAIEDPSPSLDSPIEEPIVENTREGAEQAPSFDDMMRAKLEKYMSKEGEDEYQKKLEDAKTSDAVLRTISNLNIMFGSGKPTFDESGEQTIKEERKDKLQELQNIQKAYKDLRTASSGMSTEDYRNYLESSLGKKFPPNASKSELSLLSKAEVERQAKEKSGERSAETLDILKQRLALANEKFAHTKGEQRELKPQELHRVIANEALIGELENTKKLLQSKSANKYMGPVSSRYYATKANLGQDVPKEYIQLASYTGEALINRMKEVSGVSYRPEELERMKVVLPHMGTSPKNAVDQIETMIQKLKDSNKFITTSNKLYQNNDKQPVSTDTNSQPPSEFKEGQELEQDGKRYIVRNGKPEPI